MRDLTTAVPMGGHGGKTCSTTTRDVATIPYGSRAPLNSTKTKFFAGLSIALASNMSTFSRRDGDLFAPTSYPPPMTSPSAPVLSAINAGEKAIDTTISSCFHQTQQMV